MVVVVHQVLYMTNYDVLFQSKNQKVCHGSYYTMVFSSDILCSSLATSKAL